MDIFNNISGVVKNSSSVVWGCVSNAWTHTKPGPEVIGKSGQQLLSATNPIKLCEIATRREVLLLLQTSKWTRIAGLMGASAVALGAYGAHVLNPKPDIPVEYKSVFETANKYHFFHALAILAVPLTRRPLIVGTLMMSGMFVFCGTCYIYSLTENKDYIKYTPFGGLTLILAWIAMIF